MTVAESEASVQSPGVTPAIVPRPRAAGLLTGVVGSICALGSLIAAGLYLLPLAVLFSLVALVRGLWFSSLSGTLMAVVSCLLTIFATVTSPISAEEITKLVAAGFRTSAALPEGHSVSVVTASQSTSQMIGPAVGGFLEATKTVSSPATPPAANPVAAAEYADTPSADRPHMNKESSSHMPEAVAPPAVAPVTSKPPSATSAAKPVPSAASPSSPESPKQANSRVTAKAKVLDWPGDSISQVRAIQILLENLGLYHGTTRGTLGPSTRTAILNFQRTNGEPETGEPSEALFRALQKKAASR